MQPETFGIKKGWDYNAINQVTLPSMGGSWAILLSVGCGTGHPWFVIGSPALDNGYWIS